MKRFYASFCASEVIIAALFLVLMVALILLGSIARLIGSPLNWTIDLASCLFAWACFMAADIAWRQGGLMSVQLVTERLPPRVQRALTIVNLLLIAAFLAFLIHTGIRLAIVSSTRTFQGIAGVSYSWITASLPFGCGLLLTTTLLRLGATLGLTRDPRDLAA